MAACLQLRLGTKVRAVQWCRL